MRNVVESEVSSPPAWWCGLKSVRLEVVSPWILSPPAWWCGLKSQTGVDAAELLEVTTCVVVWIEIALYLLNPNFA